VKSVQRTLDLATAQYKAAIADYLTVITAQSTLLSAQRTQVNLLKLTHGKRSVSPPTAEVNGRLPVANHARCKDRIAKVKTRYSAPLSRQPAS